jgi:predicted dienelactone hydrolase
MQLYEIILVVLVVSAAITRVAKHAARWSATLIALAALIAIWLLFHGEIYYWQLFPALGGLLLLIIWQPAIHLAKIQRYRMAASVVATLLAMASLILLLLIPNFTLPRPTGSYPVGTRILYLQDTSRVEDQASQPGRPRELVVQLWYPAAASNDPLDTYQRRSETTLATSYRSVLPTNSRVNAPLASRDTSFTVLLYNHGWNGRRTIDTFLTEELASHGYVVVAIDHTYNSGQVAMPDGRVIEDAFGYDPIDPAKHSASQIVDAWNKELRRWVADDKFVLNFLQSEDLDSKSIWHGRLDTNRVGAFGHSFGGSASVQLCTVDPRVRAGLNMDGWTFGDIGRREADRPIMFIYGGVKLNSPPDLTSGDPATRTEAELDSLDAKEVNTSLKQAGGYKLFVEGTSHMDFTDHTLIFPWRNWRNRDHISPIQIQTILRAYVVAFFDQTLHNERPALLQAPASPYRQVQIEQFKPIAKTSASSPQP